MSSIKSLLGGASGAMGAHRSMMDLIGRNISNANTPGYSRQRAGLTADPFGRGVLAGPAESVRSHQILRSILGAEQQVGFQSGRTMTLELAEPALNDLEGGGVSTALDQFFLAVSELSGNPAGLPERQNVLGQAQSLADSINQAAAGLESARSSAEGEAKATAAHVNLLTRQIGDLNDQIRKAQGAGIPTGELVDQRDQMVKTLGQEVDIETMPQPDGSLSISLGSGANLVDHDRVSRIEVGGGGSGPLSISVVKPTGTTLNIQPPGGRLGGFVEARDVTLASSVEQLDQMAFAFGSEMNAIHEAGFGLDGSQGLRLFDLNDDPVGAAASLKLSSEIEGNPEMLAASSTLEDLPGGDQLITKMLNVQDDSLLPGGRTVSEGWDGVVFTVSSALHESRVETETAVARAESFEAMRLAESGVSIQEEMMNLSQAERAFQAASQVISTANSLYDSVLQMV